MLIVRPLLRPSLGEVAMIYLHTHQPFSGQTAQQSCEEAILSFQLSVLYIPFFDPELAANDLSLIWFFILCLPGLTGSRTRQIAQRRLSPRQLSSELKFLYHFSYALKWIKARGVGFCGGPLSSLAIAFNHCNNDQRNEISSNSIWIFPFSCGRCAPTKLDDGWRGDLGKKEKITHKIQVISIS